jgi:hypothetical protein
VEYVEGKTVCIDCGSTLVENLEEAKEPIKFLETEKEQFAKKFVEFLNYSKVPNAFYEYNEEDKKWIVLIDESTKKQVVKLYEAFYSVEATGIAKESNSDTKVDTTDSAASNESEDEYSTMFDEEELENIAESRKPKAYIPPAYVKKEDQFRDLKSTAFTFFFVSLLGIVVLILNAVGVISLFAGAMIYIVMGGLFIAFLYIGISTYAKSKKVEKEITSETDLTLSIEKWLHQNITKANLDSIDEVESNPEISFLKRLDYMKEVIIDEFGDLDDSYLDHLVEEYYNANFETQAI